MQQAIALSDGGRPTGHFRNTAYVINESRAHFDAAHAAGLMAVRARATAGRAFALGTGPLEDRARAIDFVRCSYLGLDNHPVIVAGAIEALTGLRSLGVLPHVSSPDVPAEQLDIDGITSVLPRPRGHPS